MLRILREESIACFGRVLYAGCVWPGACATKVLQEVLLDHDECDNNYDESKNYVDDDNHYDDWGRLKTVAVTF